MSSKAGWKEKIWKGQSLLGKQEIGTLNPNPFFSDEVITLIILQGTQQSMKWVRGVFHNTESFPSASDLINLMAY